MRLVYAILVVQYTVHVQGRITNFAKVLKMSEWYWFLRRLLSSLITNLTILEMSWSPDSRKIRLAKYMAYTVACFVSGRLQQIQTIFSSPHTGKKNQPILLCVFHIRDISIDQGKIYTGATEMLVELTKKILNFYHQQWRIQGGAESAAAPPSFGRF